MKENEIKISVVVPVYNSETYIEGCIEALLSQNYPVDHYEIIMVDNNSKDCSPEIIKRYPDIKYLKRDKQGSYAARNKGILHAKGEIIAFTDADCEPSVDWLRNIEDAFRQPEINVIIGRNQFASDSYILSMLTGYEAAKAAYAFSNDDKTVYYGYTNNMATRKELFDRLGLFLEISRGSDVIFVRRVVDDYSCDAVRYFDNITVRHLEISNQYAYFRKRYIYGKSFKNYNKIKNARSLTTKERLKVFKATCKTNHYSLTKSGLLFIILIIGAFYFELGRKGGHLYNETRYNYIP